MSSIEQAKKILEYIRYSQVDIMSRKFELRQCEEKLKEYKNKTSYDGVSSDTLILIIEDEIEEQERYYEMISTCITNVEDPLSAILLRERYINNKTIEVIAEEYCFSRRNVSRLIKRAIKQFAAEIEEVDLDIKNPYNIEL